MGEASTNETLATRETHAHGLVRVLGPRIATAVVVGNVIGSGIFLKPGNIAAEAGQFGVIISVWVIGGLLCILGGLCFAELGTMYPHAGGLYVYLREAYGRPVAFLFGWTEVFFGKPASIGALSVAFVGSLSLALGGILTPVVQVLLAIVLIVGIAWVNILGVLWGGRLQMLVTIVKAAFLALVAIVPFLLIPFVSESINIANYSSTVAPRQSGLAAQVGVVLLAVMWAYNGWHGVTPLAEEVTDPQRSIPFALFTGIGILIVLYLAANFAYHGVLSMSEMKAAGDHAAEEMLKKLFGQGGLAAMSAVIMCSTFGAINTNLLQAPRITFAMGRDGVFFRSLGMVHATFRTPAMAIAVMAAMSIGLILAVAVAKQMVREPPVGSATEFVAKSDSAPPNQLWPLIVASLRNDSIFSLLTNFVIFSASIFYMLGVFAVIVLRIRQPDIDRPYRTWGYPVVPLLFVTVYVWFMLQIYRSNPLESRTGLLFIALGVPIFLAYRYIGKPRSPLR
ncbi:MAG: amino acid permease [Planctomycetaceae bacterium]|nr:amino acid permease [Planctomycetales bacterium]MCB9940132.1 amino acid permease [Planctomycetaceae bacterium]